MEYYVQAGESIISAMGKLLPGDTLWVRAGTYYETPDFYNSGEQGKLISVIAYPGEEVVLEGNGGSLNFGSGIQYIKLDGFIINNANVLLTWGAKYCVVSNNKISNAPSIGIDLSGGTTGNLIENNEISGSGHGIHTSGSCVDDIFRGNICHDNSHNGLGLASGIRLKVENNVCYNNGRDGIEYNNGRDGVIRGNLCYLNSVNGLSDYQYEMAFWGGSNLTIENNTCIGREGRRRPIVLEGQGHKLRNNIGVRFDAGSVINLYGSVDADYNLWWSAGKENCILWSYDAKTLAEYQKASGMGLHSLSQDPKLDADYKLLADSPCIAAGEDGVNIGCDIGQPTPEPEPEPEPEPQPMPEYVKKSILIEAFQGMIDKIKGE